VRAVCEGKVGHVCTVVPDNPEHHTSICREVWITVPGKHRSDVDMDSRRAIAYAERSSDVFVAPTPSYKPGYLPLALTRTTAQILAHHCTFPSIRYTMSPIHSDGFTDSEYLRP
jgi:hypothetical protein